MIKIASVEDVKLINSFQSVRKQLLNERFADRMEKPLAYWALPNDRRLPLAFLGRILKDLLNTPFEDLSATPGIGQKKISSLVKLLARATKDQPPTIPFGISENTGKRETGVGEKSKFASRNGFDPSIVSEAMWSQWRETVRAHGAGNELMGRLAPSLEELPTVIWRTPLEQYVDKTLGEIRDLRTHGEKRIRVIMEVFFTVHQTLSLSPPESHLTVRLVPKFVGSIEKWVESALNSRELPTPDEVKQHLAVPLLKQLEADSSATVVRLAESRLGINTPAQSVRNQSKRMGVTRARVYQLLEECGNVMSVRWPEGVALLEPLIKKLAVERDAETDDKLFRATLDLFFPRETLSEDNDAGQ